MARSVSQWIKDLTELTVYEPVEETVANGAGLGFSHDASDPDAGFPCNHKGTKTIAIESTKELTVQMQVMLSAASGKWYDLYEFIADAAASHTVPANGRIAISTDYPCYAIRPYVYNGSGASATVSVEVAAR